MTATRETIIAENLQRIQQQIADAALRSGRTSDEVRLIAVTKYVSEKEIAALIAAGCRDFGESRPQSLWIKTLSIETLCIETLGIKASRFEKEDLHWHLIGHLQTNKIRRTLPLVTLIHSLDRVPLLEALQEEAVKQSQIVTGLLEVNISQDESKHGFHPDEVEGVINQLQPFSQIKVTGLMTMAARDGGEKVARQNFQQLRTLRDQLQKSTGCELPELSMGMSGDFQVAIEEGATMVRVGSALFEGLPEETE